MVEERRRRFVRNFGAFDDLAEIVAAATETDGDTTINLGGGDYRDASQRGRGRPSRERFLVLIARYS